MASHDSDSAGPFDPRAEQAQPARQADPASDQRMLRLLIETTEQGVWFIDTALRTTDANPAMCRMLGLERADLIGRPIWDFVDPANAGVFSEHLARRARGEPGRYEITLVRADGQVITCVNDATPLIDGAGRQVGSVGLWTDITALKQVEQRLAQQSQALSLTVESLLEGVFTTGSDGRAVVWNRRLQTLLDLPDELLARAPTIAEVRDFQVARGDFAHDPQFASPVARQQVKIPYRRISKDQRVLEVDERRTADGCLVRIYRDVTADARAAEALRASEQHFRRMADGAPALIWYGGADGAPQWFNQRWLAYTGRALQEELALGWSHRLAADEPGDEHGQGAARHAAAVAARETFEVEVRVRRADGSIAWIVDHGIPRHDEAGRFEGFTCYGWDISERKAAEQALATARDEAERLSRAKSEFLSRMSHELRTPLNAVLGFAQLLAGDTAEPLTPRQHERVRELQRGGTHLLHLIDDVLDLARIEAGRLALRLQPVALAPLVDECVGLLAALARDAGVELLVEPGPASQVHADPLRLKQVLLNLMSNAIKYGRRGGRTRVRWRPTADERVRVAVQDEGLGLGPEQQQRLFVAFERLGAERRGVEGAGIGLALSKWLVELMQGQIGVDSRPGEGSEFWLTLAQAAPEAAAAGGPQDESRPMPMAAATPPPVAMARRRRVLYIEDNEVNRVLMQGMLAQRPAIDLLLAALPEEGLAMATATPPELVLLDIQLPGIDGFEVLRRLRAEPGTASIPVVAVSANAMPSDRERAAVAGFAEYVTKPIDLAGLLLVVDRWLGP